MTDYVDQVLIDRLWQDLDGQVPRQQIVRAATEVAAAYQHAGVTTYVPIFVYRRALERLLRELGDAGHLPAGSLRADGE